MNKFEKYQNKVINEFLNKGWDTTKLNRTIKTESQYKKYVELVKKERYYNKDRQKVIEESKKLKSRFEESRKKFNKRRAFEFGMDNLNSKTEATAFSQIVEQYDLRKSDFTDIKKMKELASKKIMDAIKSERTLDSGKKVKGLLVRFYEEEFMKKHIEELERLTQTDSNIFSNMFKLENIFLESIVEHYKEARDSTDYFEPSEEFYDELGAGLVRKYKKVWRK